MFCKICIKKVYILSNDRLLSIDFKLFGYYVDELTSTPKKPQNNKNIFRYLFIVDILKKMNERFFDISCLACMVYVDS